MSCMREIKGIPIWGISEKGMIIEYGLYVLLLSFMIISGMKAICRLLINRGRQIKKRMQILSLIQCDTTPLLMSSKNTKRKKVIDSSIPIKKSEKIFSVLNNNSTSKGFHYLNPGVNLNDIILSENDGKIKLNLVEVGSLRRRREKDIEIVNRRKKEINNQTINVKDLPIDTRNIEGNENENENNNKAKLSLFDKKISANLKNEIIKESVPPDVETDNINTKVGENIVEDERKRYNTVSKNEKKEVDVIDQNDLKSESFVTESERQVQIGKGADKIMMIPSIALSRNVNIDLVLDHVLASSDVEVQAMNVRTSEKLITSDGEEVLESPVDLGSNIGITIISGEMTSSEHI